MKKRFNVTLDQEKVGGEVIKNPRSHLHEGAGGGCDLNHELRRSKSKWIYIKKI